MTDRAHNSNSRGVSSPPESPRAQRRNVARGGPWAIVEWDHEEKRGGHLTRRLELTLDLRVIENLLRKTTARQQGPNTRLEVIPGTQTSLWCVWSRSMGTRRLQWTAGRPWNAGTVYGVWGFQVRPAVGDDGVRLFIDHPFSVGAPPKGALLNGIAAMAAALGHNQKPPNGLTSAIEITSLFETRFSPTRAMGIQSAIPFGDHGWGVQLEDNAIRWIFDRENPPNTNLWTDPPAEVFESRQVGAPATALDRVLIDNALAPGGVAANEAMTRSVDPSKSTSSWLNRRYQLATRMDAQQTQDELATLAATLGPNISEFDHRAEFVMAFSEALGDQVLHDDPATALDLLGAATASPDCPVAMRLKRSALAAALGDVAAEIHELTLSRLSPDAPRLRVDDRLASLHAKLAPAATKHLEYALSALRQHRHDMNAITRVTNALRQLGQPLRAAETIDRVLRSSSVSLQPGLQSELHSSLADIWANAGERPDIAASHAAAARTLAPNSIRARELELTIAKRNGAAPDALAKMALALIPIAVDQRDIVALRSTIACLDELRAKDGVPGENRALRCKAIASALVPLDAPTIQSIARGVPGVDWRILYNTLTRQLSSHESHETHLALATIADRHLRNVNLAMPHYIHVFDDGALPPEILPMLADHLEVANDRPRLARALTHLLDATSGHGPRHPLLRRAARLTDVLSESLRANIALELAITHNEPASLVRLMGEHLAREDHDAAFGMLRHILGSDAPRDRKTHVLNAVAPILRDAGTTRLRSELDDFLRDAIAHLGDDLSLHRFALESLGEHPETSAGDHAIALVRGGELPLISESFASQVLPPMELARFLTRRSLIHQDSSEARRLALAARSAIEGLDPDSTRDITHDIDELLFRVAECPDDELTSLRDRCERQGRHEFYMSALRLQIDLSSDTDRRRRLRDELATSIAEHRGDYGDASALYQQAWLGSLSQSSMDLGLAQLARLCGNSDTERDLLLSFLRATDAVETPNEVVSAITRLASMGPPDETIAELGVALIAAFQGREDHDAAGRLALAMHPHWPHREELLYPMIDPLSEAADVDTLADIAARILSSVDAPTNAPIVLARFDQAFIARRRPHLLWQTLRALLNDKASTASTIAPTTLAETLAWVGDRLFNQSDRQTEALEAYRLFQEHCPRDKRWAMPLYFLLLQSADKSAIVDHLKLIIPLIQKSPSILGNLPVTLESLSHELERLAPDEVVVASPTASTEDPAASSIAAAGDSRSHIPAASEPEILDWRLMLTRIPTPDTPSAVLAQPFTNTVEKHVALQVASLLSGHLDDLAQWQWPVWRAPATAGYPLSGKSRLPDRRPAEILSSPLARLILALNPYFAAARRDAFQYSALATRTGISHDTLKRRRSLIAWDAPVFGHSGISRWRKALEARNYKAYAIDGLRDNLFLEPTTRSLLIDPIDYHSRPPGHLYCRLLRLIRAAETPYFIALTLAANGTLLSDIQQALTEINSNSPLRLLANLGFGLSARASALASLDIKSIQQLADFSGAITDDSVSEVVEAMEMSILKIIVSDSLDIVGACESLADVDLLAKGDIRRGSILEMSTLIRPLLEFVARLKF